MTDIDKIEVGKRIKSLRTRKGLTMEEFGKIFDPEASKSIVSRWEKGKTLPSSERLKQLSDTFNLSTYYILYGKPTEYDVFQIHVDSFDDSKITRLSELINNNNVKLNTQESYILELKKILKEENIPEEIKSILSDLTKIIILQSEPKIIEKFSRILHCLGRELENPELDNSSILKKLDSIEKIL